MFKKFKTVLFGYKKSDVCEYISAVSDELAEKYKKELEAVREKLEVLEGQNANDNAEENTKAEVETVAEIILDARQFANELKEKARMAHAEAVAENERQVQLAAERIKKYNNDIDRIRLCIQSVLTESDVKLAQLKDDLNSIEVK